jgi:hypothetical protein
MLKYRGLDSATVRISTNTYAGVNTLSVHHFNQEQSGQLHGKANVTRATHKVALVDVVRGSIEHVEAANNRAAVGNVRSFYLRLDSPDQAHHGVRIDDLWVRKLAGLQLVLDEVDVGAALERLHRRDDGKHDWVRK